MRDFVGAHRGDGCRRPANCRNLPERTPPTKQDNAFVTPSPRRAVVFATGTGVEKRVTGAPPASLRVLSWPPARNPSDWLSDEQKKPLTPSVPGSWRQAGLAIGLTHNT